MDRSTGEIHDQRTGDLPSLLRFGDLLVLNDAATLPASLHGTTSTGVPVEARLVAREPDGTWTAVFLGAGDFRTRTEFRPPPPPLLVGDRIRFGRLEARVASLLARSPRLVVLDFFQKGAAFWSELYSLGRPVQYAHVERPLSLWHVQLGYASRPWAAEMPSAGRPLTFRLLRELRRAGVALATLTHASGLSDTGDPSIDRELPLPERFDIPDSTVAAVASTRSRGGRVVAVGTTVVRALEGCAAKNRELVAGVGETDLVVTADFAPRIVDGLFTGIHETTSSHFRLLRAFAPAPLLHRALDHAERNDHLAHEFGDSMLLL